MFNNDSPNEEAQNWMDYSFLFDKLPLYEFNQFNNGESDFRFKEDIINSITTLNKLNVNENNINANTKEKSNIFKVTIKNNKLGRKKRIEIEILTDTGHSKYHPDNMKTKIQVHYISFIFKFVNIVIRILGYKEQFDKIDYSLKRNVSKKNINRLEEENIEYILTQKKSKKYKNSKEENKDIYEKLKNEPILRNIFSYNYKEFFYNFYCNKETNINLNKFDSNLNVDINLDKYGAKIYKHLKEKNINDPMYIKKMDQIVKNMFKTE